MEYTGYQQIKLTADQINEFYHTDNIQGITLNPNEYLYSPASGGGDQPFYLKRDGDHLAMVPFHYFDNEWSGKVKPRNPQQYMLCDLLANNDVTLKLTTGRFGSGKTFLLVAAALDKLSKGECDKIVWVRNNVQVKDTDPLGALPGSEFDKVLPYVMPMADHCGGIEGIRNLLDQQLLDVIPLGFLRGRSIRNSIIISTEAENLTRQHIQLLIGRVDEGSQLWLDGDIKQRDRATFEKSAGLEAMVENLKDNPLFGYIHLEKSERSATAALADLLD